MVFDSRIFAQPSGQTLVYQDRFRQIELAVGFRKLICHRCDFASFYRFRVLHIRRSPELLASAEEEVRDDHFRIWKTIPRFAEIPETVRCRRCDEVLGVYTSCIF